MNVPKLRFKEFDGEWEENNLKKLLSLLKDGTHGTHKDVLKGPYLLSAKNIINGAIRISENDRKISMEEFNSIYKNYELRKGDVLLSIVGTIGRTAIVSDEKLIAFQRSVAILRSEKLFPSFLLYLIQSQNFQHQLQVKKVVSAQPGVYLGDIGKIKVNVPEMNEQKKISDLLLSLDKKIQLQQQKIDLLQEQKKGFLQKMFPKFKKVYPKVRFGEFSEEWKLYKLSEVFVKGGSGGTPKSTNKTYYDGNIPFLGISDISKSRGFIHDTEKHISDEGLKNSAAWIVPSGAISLAMYASVGKLAILNTELATSQAFYNMIFEDDDLRNYVYQCLCKANEFGEWIKLISTGTQANLNADKVKNFEIAIPSNKKEVSKISNLFMQMDQHIILQQYKLNLLKKQKKGFMQQMFI